MNDINGKFITSPDQKMKWAWPNIEAPSCVIHTTGRLCVKDPFWMVITKRSNTCSCGICYEGRGIVYNSWDINVEV